MLVCIGASPLDTMTSYHDVGVYTIDSWEGEGGEGKGGEERGGRQEPFA